MHKNQEMAQRRGAAAASAAASFSFVNNTHNESKTNLETYLSETPE